MRSNINQLISIQYLRAIATLMVVLHHARNPQKWLFNPLEGYGAFAWGVDIFFVISGFIMFVAARNENHVDFLGRRIIRVAPLYWLATLAFLALNTHFHIWRIGVEGFTHVAQSLFFIPHYNLDHPDQIWPYLIPGWTLNYEMLFYLIFFVGLLVRHPLIVTTTTILALFVMGLAFNPDQVVLKAYTKPILLEFLCGVWIAWAYTKGFFNRTAPVVIVIGFAMLFVLPFFNAGELTIVGRIIASSLVITGALLLGGYLPNFKLLNLLGDASYSIYLTHTAISLGVASRLWQHVPIEGWTQFVGWVIVALVFSSIVGVLVHLYVEKPALRWLRGKWERFLSNKRLKNTRNEIA